MRIFLIAFFIELLLGCTILAAREDKRELCTIDAKNDEMVCANHRKYIQHIDGNEKKLTEEIKPIERIPLVFTDKYVCFSPKEWERRMNEHVNCPK